MRNKTCEFCLLPKVTSPEDTVCNDCDAKMAFEYAMEDSDRAAKHAAKYKCRSCGCGLTESRTLQCVSCLPELGHDSGDFLYVAEDEEEQKPAPLRVIYTTFDCSGCAATQLPIEYAAKNGNKKPTRCKGCERKRSRLQYEAASTRLAARKASAMEVA
jgi:hypothetical protein